MKKIIGVCGAHGTGKTTLIKELAAHTGLPIFHSTSTALWRKYKITDFEILPMEIRSIFQSVGVLEHIKHEDAFSHDTFISDRTILDYLMYTVSSSDLSGVDLAIHKALIKERMKIYHKFIFIKPHPEITKIVKGEEKFARAKIELQQQNTDTAEQYLNEWSIQYHLVEEYDLSQRVKSCLEYIES